MGMAQKDDIEIAHDVDRKRRRRYLRTNAASRTSTKLDVIAGDM